MHDRAPLAFACGLALAAIGFVLLPALGAPPWLSASFVGPGAALACGAAGWHHATGGGR